MAYLDHISTVEKGTDYQNMEEMIMMKKMMMPEAKKVKGVYADKANYSSSCGYMGGMNKKMGYGGGGLHLVMGVITWMAVVALLISLARYFWNKGDK